MSHWHQRHLQILTQGRRAYEITEEVNQCIAEVGVQQGLVHLFLQHTSASLILCENADSTVLTDLERILQGLAPDGDPEYLHNYEGVDDMAAHIRAVLTQNDLSVPIIDGSLSLGTWQGVFLYEHRYHPHSRKLIITINGEP